MDIRESFATKSVLTTCMEKTVIFAVASVLEENHVTQKQASVRSGVLLATAMMTECASQNVLQCCMAKTAEKDVDIAKTVPPVTMKLVFVKLAAS